MPTFTRHPEFGIGGQTARRFMGSTSGIHIRLKERAFQKRIQCVQPPGVAGVLRRVRRGFGVCFGSALLLSSL